MQEKTVILSSDSGCYRLILNQSDRHNALNPEMIDALHQALQTVKNDQIASMLIIQAKGDHFMVGGDIYYFSKLIKESPSNRIKMIQPMLDKAQSIIEIMMSLNIPVVGVTSGIVAGYGLSLILACDYVLSLSTSDFYSSYIDIGLTADGGQLLTLENAIGLKYAKRMLFFNEKIDAKEAKRIGLIDCLCQSDESLNEGLNALIKKINHMPKEAFKSIKKQLVDLKKLNEILDIEKGLFLKQIASEEFTSRVSHFIKSKSI